jgi:hypothetical protein
VPIDFGGGASLFKALVLADLIIANNLLRTVEIGVYRGRLLLTLAVLMKTLGRGEVVGIDPYSEAEAVQHDPHNRGVDLEEWPTTVDWDALHDGVVTAIEQIGLEERARVIRLASQDVAGDFAAGSIDMLHVDGNHDRVSVARDVELFVPKMSSRGFVVLDDVSWPSVRPVFEQLRDAHELIFQMFDSPAVGFEADARNDFAIFRLSS